MWRRRLLLVLLLGSGARYLSAHSTVSQADKSDATVPTLIPEIQRVIDHPPPTLPSVGDCLVKKAGDEYEIAPCSRPHFGKVLKALQASDYAPSAPLGRKCPPASDDVLSNMSSIGLHEYCIDTNG
jgi:hypothetical protein